MSEFTGERVIPGQVNDDLWAEHMARYALATRFAQGRRVLDLGCGTGYGTADLAQVASSAVGVDLAPEAIAYADEHFPSARFLQCSASAVPFPPASFDLVTAFEVIEHLRDWRALLAEAHRVLEPNGLLIVSTPNKRYYAEARAKSGPNPFHEHEFEFQEFRTALGEFFPHLEILFQDRIEAFAFYDGTQKSRTEADLARPSGDPETANFFIGICSCAPIPQLASFLYAPRAANLLREREEHIRLLEQELAQVRTWLEETTADRNHLQTQLESEQTRALQIITELNEENRRKTDWALNIEKSLTAQVEQRTQQLAEAVRLLDTAEATVVERTDWARRLDTQLRETAAQLEMVRQSRWLKLGRQLRLGPQVKEAAAKEAME
ncbi:MAG: methyltransferase domain-containing protein [Acidobacteriia bacterium]|nr:methyltransferase domain-containing protein [Terriglobia bacterium]